MVAQFHKETWSICTHCKGKGVSESVFQNTPRCACLYCNAIGWLMPDGSAVAEHDALMMLREQLNMRSFQAKYFQQELAKLSQNSGSENPLAEYYSTPGYKGD